MPRSRRPCDVRCSLVAGSASARARAPSVESSELYRGAGELAADAGAHFVQLGSLGCGATVKKNATGARTGHG